MPINIQNIVNQINTRLGSVDSNTSTSEIIRLTNLAEHTDASSGILEYQFPNQLPTVDSANIGSLAYIRETDFYLDSAGQLNGHYPKYFFAKNDSDGWIEIELETLANADSDNFAYVNSGDAVIPYTFQGSVSGYASGGFSPTVPGALNRIQSFPFAADADATDVSNLTQARYSLSSQSSDVSGYSAGGDNGPVNTNVIDKFSFAASNDATDVGDLLAVIVNAVGQSSQNYGYSSGGELPATTNRIEKFSFAVDENSVDVANLTQSRNYAGGQSSDVSGYTSGGYDSYNRSNVIDKFPFASDGDATDVGNLSVTGYGIAGQSSDVNGYNSGGNTVGGYTDAIDKFPFASDGNATDVGNLFQSRAFTSGQSSQDYGYTSGGRTPTRIDIIEKVSFASDGNGTDVGNLLEIVNSLAGHQV